MDLRIDKEFAEKIPPLTKEEFDQLEANILADGRVINPLITWNGVIVDGHNRYRILQRHPEIAFQTYEKDFSDRYEVIAWICKNQLGRRNLTPAQRKYLIGKQYEAEKRREVFHGNQHTFGNTEVGGGQNVHHRAGEKTSERIAKSLGLNERFVRRAEEFAKGVDAAEEISPGIRQKIFSGTIRPSDKDVTAISHASADERKPMVDWLMHPKQQYPDNGKPRKPFKPSIASIRAISEQMESDPNHPRGVVDTEFIILELEDALASMMFRWDTCLSDYKKEASAEDCQAQIKGLALEGIRYLQQFVGGETLK